ncbi:MAG: glycosyltransferase family 39 protein [Planctomycetes bacterium]|nr:glycosyltransferase family 39 protein [Planctomycetota bacterium]
MPRRAWLLALAAAALRAAAAFTVVVIESDGARNLRMAELIGQGRFAEALLVRTPTPPLHPFLTALLDSAVGNLHVAGVALSVLLGGLAVLPLYAMARRTWDDRVATLGAALYAVLPAIVDFQIEPITEGAFLFLFFSAMALGWSALEEKSWERTVAAAGCAALAWLTRAEGIYLLPLFLAAAALRFSRFSFVAIPVFFSVWLILAFPYLSFIHAQTGHWQASLSPIPGMIRDFFSGERTATGMDFDEYRAVQKHGRLIGGAAHLGAYFFGKVLFYVLGPFLVLGLFKPRPAEGRRTLLAYQLLAAFGYLLPIFLSFFASTPFSHRFLLAPAALLLPVTAVGLVRAAEWTRRREALPVMAGALCLAMAVRDFRPRRADKAGMKEAGLAILKTLGPGKRLFATNGQIEFYAKSAYVPLPEDATFETLQAARLDAFAFCLPELRRWEPRLEERIRERHAAFGEFPAPPRKDVLPVRVYLAKP